MHRPQFSLKTLLWLTLVAAAFFAGARAGALVEQHRLFEERAKTLAERQRIWDALEIAGEMHEELLKHHQKKNALLPR